MGSKYSRPKAQAPLEIQLLDFLYGEWRGFSSKLVKTASRQTLDEGPDFRLIPRQYVHHGRYFLELIIRLLRTKNGGSPTVSGRFLATLRHGRSGMLHA